MRIPAESKVPARPFVTLCVASRDYALDRQTCAASSPYFARLLNGPMRESGQDRIALYPPVTTSFGKLAAFVRTGKTPDFSPGLAPLLINADYFLVAPLCDVLVRQFGKYARQVLGDPATQTLADEDPMLAEALLAVRDSNGQTPLHAAAARGESRNGKALINAGACVLARDAMGRMPLHTAAQSGRWIWWIHGLGRADALVGSHDRDAMFTTQDSAGHTPIHILVQRGDGERALRWMRSLSEPARCTLAAQTDAQGQTLLHLAAQSSEPLRWELLDDLFLSGADVLARDAQGRTVGHFFAQRPEQYEMSMLVNSVRRRRDLSTCAALMRTQDNEGRTPLHVMARRGGSLGLLDVARTILDVRDKQGDTALHFAVAYAKMSRHPKAIRRFDRLWRAASHHIPNNNGQTAAQLAFSWGLRQP